MPAFTSTDTGFASGQATAGNSISVVPSLSTMQSGQVIIAATGTAVQLSTTSYVLLNGIVISAKSTNATAQGTVGASGVTNTVNGTGNGVIIAPGASVGFPPGINLNTIYVNGTINDVFSFIGS